MTAWNPQPSDDSAGAAWRSLSGDPLPAPPHLSTTPEPQAPQQPVHGGWQQPWQDEHGQWHYPYAQYAAPRAAPGVAEPVPSAEIPVEPIVPAEPVEPIVPVEQLEPVGPPRYLAPARPAQDPRRRTLAAVITFVSLLIGLWAILGFMGALSKTLASVSSGSSKLEQQLVTANEGLVALDRKTGHLEQMSTHSKALSGLLGTIDTDMGTMLTGVDGIASGMTSMHASLGTLESELEQVNTINAGMAGKLATINAGLASQVKSVRTMRRDVQATGTVLGGLPGRLDATNSRLGHVNNSVNIMGCAGITNNLEVDIRLGPIPNGSAKVYATVVPPGAWGTRADGVTPC